jgi:hypothetical protein
MQLHRGAPRAPKVRWALRWLERKRLMAEILRGMQIMHLYLMLDAFNPILATAVLEAKDLPPFVMFSLLFPCVGKLKIAGIMQAVSRAMECYFERSCKLGAGGQDPSTRGNMELFPISSGGGQFTFVPLTLWYKFATRGCRWICYSNCRSNPSKVSNIIEILFTLDWRM